MEVGGGTWRAGLGRDGTGPCGDRMGKKSRM